MLRSWTRNTLEFTTEEKRRKPQPWKPSSASRLNQLNTFCMPDTPEQADSKWLKVIGWPDHVTGDPRKHPKLSRPCPCRWVQELNQLHRTADTDLMESPVPFMVMDAGRSDEAWLLITETRLVASEGGAGLVLTMTVPPAPATVGGGNLPTGFRL